MHVHILGICGTFMGSLALLARELGYRVSGADQNVYPPMSVQLADAGIELHEGYDGEQLAALAPDLVVVGNALSRGVPVIETLLDSGLRYCSGPAWLAEHVLRERWVIAVAGTHGKTTTSSMLAWILEHAGLAPGFLIGGVPGNFPVSARLGDGRHFVIEADEYDTAFFDKRSKFVHYSPRTVVLNNLEFDHADIFDDLAAIQRQFHHLLRIVPPTGTVLLADQPSLREVIDMGCWSSTEFLSGPQSPWRYDIDSGGALQLACEGQAQRIDWQLRGEHNAQNAVAAIAAARQLGVDPKVAATALASFTGVKRRLELIATMAGIQLYDDFAHHPTAIRLTLEGLRAEGAGGRIIAVIEPRSNTMRSGVHNETLAAAVASADLAWWQVEADADALAPLRAALVNDARNRLCDDVDQIVAQLVAEAHDGDRIVIMSNGGFGGIHGRLRDALAHANK